MPIRMVKDPTQNTSDNYPGGGGGGGLPGGNGCLFAFLPLLFRNPKLLILLIVIGVAFYFLGGKSCISNMSNVNQTAGEFALGADLNQAMYDKAEVFEPLADNIKNPLPERVTLEQYAPQRLNQGKQGSCVAWSSAYSARTIMRARETGENPDQIAFSPSFLYNQIGLDNCQGSYIIRAMESMNKVGALPLKKFPYNEEDCTSQPQQYQLQEASAYKINGFNRLSKSGDDYKVDMLAIKQNLAQGAPVVIGAMVGGSFMGEMKGQKVWIPSRSDYSKMGFGGHAMCVIGYDDYLEGGAFQIMNSWGTEWGENGVAWIRYKDFDFFVKEAYGIYPMGNAVKQNENQLQAEFGLVSYNNQTGDLKNLPAVPLKYTTDITYQTVSPLKKGEKFKVAVANSSACYTYIFGQETDGSSYVLFPYTPKHSPYCGITGLRYFPKDFSMQADEKGNKDFMAVVMTKKPIDYKVLNQAIAASKQATYAEKVKDAVRGQMKLLGVRFVPKNGNVMFSTSMQADNAIAFVIEVDKQ